MEFHSNEHSIKIRCLTLANRLFIILYPVKVRLICVFLITKAFIDLFFTSSFLTIQVILWSSDYPLHHKRAHKAAKTHFKFIDNQNQSSSGLYRYNLGKHSSQILIQPSSKFSELTFLSCLRL